MFTDDNLERIKLSLADNDVTYMDSIASADEIRALIIRLEAAETVIYKWIKLDDSIALGSSSDMDTHNHIVDEASNAMDAWRRAKGESDSKAAGK